MSIGVLGGNYQVIVTDTQHVNHTLKIDPKEIDADRKKKRWQRAVRRSQIKTGLIAPKASLPT